LFVKSNETYASSLVTHYQYVLEECPFVHVLSERFVMLMPD